MCGPEKSRKRWLSLGGCLGITALAVFSLATATVRGGSEHSGTSPAVNHLRETGKAFANVTKRVSPAVVFVQVERKPSSSRRSEPLPRDPEEFSPESQRRFFGNRLPNFEIPRNAVGHGSGFIISAEGHILTNAHVVGGADKVQVILTDGRRCVAQVVGVDSHTDVAIIKIEAEGLSVLPLGNSDQIEVGEWVLAVGSPFGLAGTVTSGIVSAKGRNSVGIADYENFLQTDAAINPGNSGGPLVNLDGEVIGINTAIFSHSGGYMGVGFAIPINMAKEIRDQLIEKGTVTRGHLGIVIQKLTPELSGSFGIEGTNGILVAKVARGSAAEKSGLKPGDVIVKFDGQVVKNMGRFRNRVAHVAPDTVVKVTVIRDGQEQLLTIKMGRLSSLDDLAETRYEVTETLGVVVTNLTEELSNKLGYEGETGVVVMHVDSTSGAARAGIRPGSLIKEVNRVSVEDMDQLQEEVKKSIDQQKILLLLQQGSYCRFVMVPTDA